MYKLLELAGMPAQVLDAYRRFLEGLVTYNFVAGGLGHGLKRRYGIPQVCPFYMMAVALLMRPWIILMRCIPGVQVYILADDVLIVATGKRMVRSIAEAIDKTHAYLQSMGAKVAPDKSYNFASTQEGRKWLD